MVEIVEFPQGVSYTLETEEDKCPKCGSTDFIYEGFWTGTHPQRAFCKCKDCNTKFVVLWAFTKRQQLIKFFKRILNFVTLNK